jgi:hypothetical protein
LTVDLPLSCVAVPSASEFEAPFRRQDGAGDWGSDQAGDDLNSAERRSFFDGGASAFASLRRDKERLA